MPRSVLTCALVLLGTCAAAQEPPAPLFDPVVPPGALPARLVPDEWEAQTVILLTELEEQGLRRQLADVLQARIGQMSAAELRRAIAALEGEAAALPPAAEEVLEAYRRQAGAIQGDADRKIAVHRRQAVADLKEIQDRLTRDGQLDEAVAVRDLIRSLAPRPVNVRPDPGSLSEFRGHRGGPLHFRVRGNAAGSVWGTDVYTDDSTLAAAAVHGGALRPGQTGIVKVTLLPGREAYAGSTRHGVTTSNWGSFSGSFRVEAVRGDEAEEPAAEDPPAEEGPPARAPGDPPAASR